ncbi:MAG: homoserine O-acetyltransferase, partial [Myxococcota bacterium]
MAEPNLAGWTASRHLKSTTLFKDEALVLHDGTSLQNVRVAYETYGTLNADRSNAILVCHALTGDSHVARHDDEDAAGWWDGTVGPGKTIDTNRWFVVCSN